MKGVHIGKEYFNKGKRYQVLFQTDVAILLEVSMGKKNKAYQVIDFVKNYPKKEKYLETLNPFRTVSLYSASKEYAKRNQTKIS